MRATYQPEWITDDELAALERLADDPEQWPRHVRHELPLLRDLIALWQHQLRTPVMTADEIKRRLRI